MKFVCYQKVNHFEEKIRKIIQIIQGETFLTIGVTRHLSQISAHFSNEISEKKLERITFYE